MTQSHTFPRSNKPHGQKRLQAEGLSKRRRLKDTCDVSQDKIVFDDPSLRPVFVQPIMELGLQGRILSMLHPFVPGIPLKESPIFPSLQRARSRLGSHFPTERGETRGWKPFLPPSERCFVSAGRGDSAAVGKHPLHTDIQKRHWTIERGGGEGGPEPLP